MKFPWSAYRSLITPFSNPLNSPFTKCWTARTVFKKSSPPITTHYKYLVDSITSIGVDAFSNNVIKTITLPRQLKTIGERTFMANSLTAVIIPEGVKEIKESAFEYNQITSLYIPPSVSKISCKAFSHNPNLTQPSCRQKKANWF